MGEEADACPKGWDDVSSKEAAGASVAGRSDQRMGKHMHITARDGREHRGFR